MPLHTGGCANLVCRCNVCVSPRCLFASSELLLWLHTLSQACAFLVYSLTVGSHSCSSVRMPQCWLASGGCCSLCACRHALLVCNKAVSFKQVGLLFCGWMWLSAVAFCIAQSLTYSQGWLACRYVCGCYIFVHSVFCPHQGQARTLSLLHCMCQAFLWVGVLRHACASAWLLHGGRAACRWRSPFVAGAWRPSNFIVAMCISSLLLC